MTKKEHKLLEEMRRRGTILEDPAHAPSGGIVEWLIDLFTKKNKK